MRWAKTLMACFVLVAVCAAFLAPSTAFAAAKTKTIHATSAVEAKAYKRCLKVAKSYKKYPQTVTVNLRDLKLTKKQAQEVEELLWGNGELWWINVFGLNPTRTSITISFKYTDAKITKMRKKFEKAVKVALKRVGPAMGKATKAHMMHDYIIRAIKYKDKAKDAYTALVKKRADCFGYTLVTDVLMRRCGMKTDIAWTSENGSDHSWNLVKIGSSWFHVDTTWDQFYTYSLSAYTKAKEVCHVYLLQPDKVMAIDDHIGWKAHHKCTNKKYVNWVYVGGDFTDHCKDYKKIVRSFSKGGLKYKVMGAKKVWVAGVSKGSRASGALAIPATVKHKSATYAVIGMKAKAFANAKVKTLYVSTAKLAKSRVKNSLTASKVTSVKVPKKQLKAYKKAFAKSNSGKKVRVSAASAAKLSLRAA